MGESPIHTMHMTKDTTLSIPSTSETMSLDNNDLKESLIAGSRLQNHVLSSTLSTRFSPPHQTRHIRSFKMIRLPHWPLTCITICWLLKFIKTLTFFVSSKQQEAV